MVTMLLSYSDASMGVTEESKETITRLNGECDMRADVPHIGQLDDGTMGQCVGRVGGT